MKQVVGTNWGFFFFYQERMLKISKPQDLSGHDVSPCVRWDFS